MRIAILGSVAAKIPPEGQAAIETLAYYQVKGLAAKGHQILLFALKGSKVEGENITLYEVGEKETLSGIGREGKVKAEEIYGVSYKMRLEIMKIAQLMAKLHELQSDYDVVLNNLRGETGLIPFLSLLKKPFYHILHLPLFPELAEFYQKFQTPLISISERQQQVFPGLNYAGTVYNGVDTKEYAYSDKPEDYLLYLGSIGANKNPKEAVLSAKAANEKLVIAGRVKDKAYFDREIAPYVDGKQIIFLGEKTKSEVVKLYQGAKALLFPTLWEEPFGLVLIEALSCGTPIIAYPHGAVPEVVEDGKNGFLVSNVEEMAEKIKRVNQIDRLTCRRMVEEKFSIEKMVDGYERILLKANG